MLTGVSASVAGLETTVISEVRRRQREWQDAQTAFSSTLQSTWQI